MTIVALGWMGPAVLNPFNQAGLGAGPVGMRVDVSGGG